MLSNTFKMDYLATDTISCPFCGYIKSSQHDIQLHIEEWHTEDSPFVVKDHEMLIQHKYRRSQASPTSGETVRCTWDDCDKNISLAEIAEHLRSHEASVSPPIFNTVESDSQYVYHTQRSSQNGSLKLEGNGKARSAKRNSVLQYFAGKSYRKASADDAIRPLGPPGRLGRRDLGPHAYEKAMPSSVRRKLEEATHATVENRIDQSGHLVRISTFTNETTSLVPVLAELTRSDSSTTTYLCDTSVKHIRRVDCDGNFCGYWNIQMMLSYLAAKASVRQHGLPSVIEIQETIEKAWSKGICAYGKIETGGILNTRKWIGTSEAAAYFTQRDIEISTLAFRGEGDDRPAHLALLDWVEAYFMAKDSISQGSRMTRLAPIYLQRAGHSVTIVGVRRHRSGERNLMVFDPSNTPSQAIKRLAQGRALQASSERLVDDYCCSEAKLAKHCEYEVLMLHQCGF